MDTATIKVRDPHAQEAGLAGAFAESDLGIEAPDRTEYVITYTLGGPSPLN